MLASYLFLFNSSKKYNINKQILLQQKYIFFRDVKIINSNNCFIYLSIARGELSDYIYENNNFLFVGDYAIYNVNELIDILKLKNKQSFKIPEILVELFKRYGDEFVNYVDGDFSFLIYDKSKSIIYVYRDRLGIRPVYYYHKDDFIVSNELRLIYSIKKDYLSLNFNEFLNALLTISDNHKNTVYNEINRLPFSNFMIYNKGCLVLKKYWLPDFDNYLNFSSDFEYFDLFQKNLIESIEKRSKDWPTIAAELSGGLDSSFVTLVANNYAKKTNKNFIAFSNVFSDDELINIKDEKEYINEVLKYDNFKWIGIDCINWNYLDLLKFSTDIQGTFIIQNYPVFNISIYESAYNNNVNILFSGFGGDELLSSRQRIPWIELIEKRELKKIISILNKLPSEKMLIKSIKILLKYLLFKYFNKKPVLLNINKKVLKTRFSNLSLNKRLIKQYSLNKKFINYFHQKLPYIINERQFLKLTQPYLSLRLEYSYAIAAQYGLEYRYPLLDYKLIQLYFSFPWWFRVSENLDRFLYRNSIKNLVPEKIRLRKDKHGTVIPHAFIHFYQHQHNINNFLLSVMYDDDINKIVDVKKMINWHKKLLDNSNFKNKMYSAFNIYMGIILWMLDNKNLWIKCF